MAMQSEDPTVQGLVANLRLWSLERTRYEVSSEGSPLAGA